MACNSRYPCRYGHCAVLLDKPGYCDQHKQAIVIIASAVSEDYKERNRFYQRVAWKKIRSTHLFIEPLCRKCKLSNKLTEATIVDHIEPIELGGAKLDHDNLQSLCASCHNSKTRQASNRARRGRVNL